MKNLIFLFLFALIGLAATAQTPIVGTRLDDPERRTVLYAQGTGIDTITITPVAVYTEYRKNSKTGPGAANNRTVTGITTYTGQSNHLINLADTTGGQLVDSVQFVIDNRFAKPGQVIHFEFKAQTTAKKVKFLASQVWGATSALPITVAGNKHAYITLRRNQFGLWTIVNREVQP